jgi:hypothetical protein
MQLLEGLSPIALLVAAAATWPAIGATSNTLLGLEHLRGTRCGSYPSIWPLRFWPFRC